MSACDLVRFAYGALTVGLDAEGRDEFDALLEAEPPTVEDRLEAIEALGGEVAS